MSRIEIIFGSLFEIHLFYLADKQRLLWFYIKKEVDLDLLLMMLPFHSKVATFSFTIPIRVFPNACKLFEYI